MMTEPIHGEFESLISRPDTHAVIDLSGQASVLLILFGGIAGGVSMPVFEFFRQTSTMPGKKAFLRDPLRGWYQLGIPGIGDSAASVRYYLNSIIEQAQVERVVMAGASAGGFAAMLFGAWCAADEVIAFSPQTFIDEENRRRLGDTRWSEQIASLHRSPSLRNATFDVLPALSSVSETRVQIHVSTDDELDLIHARRTAGCSTVETVEHQNGGHRLVKTLRDRGLLRPILLDALTGRNGVSPTISSVS